MRDLFFNVPARKKFLRAERTETQHIARMVERLALSKFETAFSLSASRRSLGDFPAAKSQLEREKRVAQIVGDEFMANAMYVEHESSGCKLTGWLCQPTYARAQPDLQHFYLNGRMLRDRLISSAIRLGYRDVMFHGRHPAFVLFMEIDPRQVDVNAHPAKLEVRFRDGRHIHNFLFKTVERVLKETYAGAASAAPPPTDANHLVPTGERSVDVADARAESVDARAARLRVAAACLFPSAVVGIPVAACVRKNERGARRCRWARCRRSSRSRKRRRWASRWRSCMAFTFFRKRPTA